jgi:hypothetical protein
MELLGTKEDYIRFKEVYSQEIPSVIKSLIIKCLDLYRLREKTAEIIRFIIKREKLIKMVKLGDKKTVIEVHKLSKILRNKIKE